VEHRRRVGFPSAKGDFKKKKRGRKRGPSFKIFPDNHYWGRREEFSSYVAKGGRSK